MEFLKRLLDVTIMPSGGLDNPTDGGVIQVISLELEPKQDTLFLVLLISALFLLLFLSIRLVGKISKEENINGDI